MKEIRAAEVNLGNPLFNGNRGRDNRDDRGQDNRGRDDRDRDNRDGRDRDDRNNQDNRDDRGQDNRGRDDRDRDGRDRDDRDRGGRDDRGRDDRRRRFNFTPLQLFPQNRFPFPQTEIRFIQNGIIQRITGDNRNGFVTVVSNYNNPFGPNQNQVVTLIINQQTILRDQNLHVIRFNDLRVGMSVFAAYSARMTRSFPPQAVAFSLIAIVEEPFLVSTGIVAFVDPRGRSLTTGAFNDIYAQKVYNVNEETDIFNRFGQRISLFQIRPGDRVRIEHATFQTASIPPQTTAFRIEVLR